MKLPACIFLLLVMTPLTLFAQSTTETPVNFAVWGGYDGNLPFNETSAWRLRLSGTLKRNNGIVDPQADLLEPGIGYAFKHSKEIAGGYGVQYNIPYDSASLPYRWVENRIWEEARFKFKWSGDKTFKQGFEVQERWLARKDPPDYDGVARWEFEITFIYTIGFERPLVSNVHFVIENELHLRVVPTDEKRIDQNRFFVGVSIPLDKERRNTVELGYMLQTVRNSSETAPGLKRVNNTLRVTFISDSPLHFK